MVVKNEAKEEEYKKINKIWWNCGLTKHRDDTKEVEDQQL